MSNESTNPQLSFYSRPDWLAGFLRTDRIRLDTLVQLVASWSDPDARDEVIKALDELAAAVQSADPGEGALDAAAEDVEGAAGMDLAQVPIDRDTAMRLSCELATVTDRLCRFAPGRSVRIPQQPGQEGM